MKRAKWWQKLDSNRVQCQLCPRNCIIPNNKKGFCKTRQNIEGELYSLVYGYPVAINVDPIEKKPLFHFYPGSTVFSIGTIGCNLECKFCQNFEIARNNYEPKGRNYISPEDIVELAINNECRSIAFTYNEPTVFAEYLMDIAKLAQQNHIKTVMVTNGYINPQPLKEIYTYIDAANIDIKSFSPIFYNEICNGELEAVLNSIKQIYDLGVFIELTNLVIPNFNDNKEEILKLFSWIRDNLGLEVPIHFSAFHPDYKMKNIQRTSKSSLDNIVSQANTFGMKYVYEGNVMTDQHDNTCCPQCGALLIERQIFTVTENNLIGGYCDCGEKINIVC